MDRRFRFKPLKGSWTQIPLAVNDLTGNTGGGVRAVKAFKRLSLDRTSSAVKLQEFYSSVFSE